MQKTLSIFPVTLDGIKFTGKNSYPISILTYKTDNVGVISKRITPKIKNAETIPEFPFGAIIFDYSGSLFLIPENEKSAITVKISPDSTATVWFEYDNSPISNDVRSKPIATIYMRD